MSMILVPPRDSLEATLLGGFGTDALDDGRADVVMEADVHRMIDIRAVLTE